MPHLTVVDLPATAAAPSEARALVRRLMPTWRVSADCAEIALLLVSELVTNAVRHVGGPLTISFEMVGDVIRVDVRDLAAALPAVMEASLEAEGGRGIALVQRLSLRWGAEPLPAGGKSVWFELAVA